MHKPSLILPSRPKLITPYDEGFYDELQEAIRPSFKIKKRRRTNTEGPSLFSILTTAGYTTNLKLCLDAGAAASYSSGDKWLDLAGSAYDFFLGLDGTTDGTEPTFNGTVGGTSTNEYWSFDGGDQFTYDSATETWMDNLHKNNAIWSWAVWGWLNTATATNPWIGSAQGVGNGVGVSLYVNSSAQYRLRINNIATQLEITHSVSPSTGAWHFFGGAVDEAVGANGARMVLDGTAEQFTSTYASPSAGTATGALRLGSTGNNSNKLQSGSRIAMVAVWEGTALSSADLAAIRSAVSSARSGF